MYKGGRVDDAFYGEVSTSFKPFPSLESLTFGNMPNWEFWFPLSNSDAEVQTLFPSLVELKISQCPCYTLDVRECPHTLLRFEFPFLRELNVTDIMGLRRGLHIDLHSLNALTKLRIEAIPELARIGEWLPLELEYWETYNCRLKSLKELTIGHCPNLVVLVLNDCEGLKLLPHGRYNGNLHFLERLHVWNCPSLVCFPDELPSTLQLEIGVCTNLKALRDTIMQASSSGSGSGTRSISHLEVLKINRWQVLCNNAELECLKMWNYPNITTLEGCLDSLTHLIKLEILDCPGLEFFPLNGLPNANLKELWIENCENLKSLPPQMQNLTSSKSVRSLLSKPHVVSFRENDCLPLPRSLTWLSVNELQNLEYLAFLGLQNLNSLKELLISDCPELRSFLPDEGLPATLSRLEIKKCPILRKDA
ncbi:hypothetical protein AAG906_021849 [Vitis piasezkii]